MDRHQALQAMIESAGLETGPFPPNSRYHGIATATYTTTDGRRIGFVCRRFIPPAGEHSQIQEHTITEGDRIDNLAAKYLGDPEQYWRICDANGVLRPVEITDAIGTTIRITLPHGIAGPSA